MRLRVAYSGLTAAQVITWTAYEAGLFAHHGLRIVSMRRPAEDDPAMFQSAAAAGAVAATRIPPRAAP